MDPANLSHPQPFIIPPKSATHTTSLILLHGTSTNGESFGSPLLEPFLSPSSGTNVSLADLLPHAKFVFPSGKQRRTTVLGGQISNAWFDIWDFTDRTKGEEAQKEGLRESVEYLGLVIKEEVERLPAEGKVVVGGFSMGCAMSVFLLMSGELERLGVEDRVAGLVGWSGWVPFRRQIEEAVGKGDVRGFVRRLVGLREWDEGWDGDGRGFKVWLGHGKEDEKVLLEWGTQMRDLLTMMGYEVSWNEYAGLGHWYLPGELEDIVRFVEQAVQI